MSPSLITPPRTPSYLSPDSPTPPTHSNLLFIGRASSAPFVFSTEPRLSRTNVEWLKTADVDELRYLREIAEEDPQGRSECQPERVVVDLTASYNETCPEVKECPRTKNCARKSGAASLGWNAERMKTNEWTQAEDKALWLGQVHLSTK